MANTWKEYTLRDNTDSAVKYWVLSSDGSEETDYTLVDQSALSGSGTFTKLALMRLQIWTHSDTRWLFEWKDSSDVTLAIFDDIGAEGAIDFDFRDTDGAESPTASGTTGDLILTTDALNSGDEAAILIEVRKII